MRNFIFRIIVTVLSIVVIIWHVIAFKKDVFGIDQLIPCIVGYFSLWAILMNYELEEKSK